MTDTIRGLAGDLVASRRLILELAANDFRARYLGNYLGLLWAFINPISMILVLWFVFQVGFKAVEIGGVPFVPWLVAGMVPWMFLADGLATATQSVAEKSFLVKKVVFRVSLLPLVKIISSFAIHAVLVVLAVALALAYGLSPGLSLLQLPYYLAGAIAILVGLSWLTSSLVVFLKDIGQAVAIALQFGFWMTPIFWSEAMLPERFLPLVRLNPAFYVVKGYRDSILDGPWFWQDWRLALSFWATTVVFLLVGGTVFRKLRPHFADVL